MSRGVKCKVLLKNVVGYSNRAVGAKRFIRGGGKDIIEVFKCINIK